MFAGGSKTPRVVIIIIIIIIIAELFLLRLLQEKNTHITTLLG